ncbi:LPS export ABC transporter permease LptG [Coxiella endosymbiont of Amblyomma nuttalli]|uniref:LPS export ABC transporter permease LptG n=1 Tax=Coxiella endosymbiont of Amblyomma nuttalli TaxID=2749996 RepID=UPI001BADB041|nr:LPS export ABC transporter permease LptG [Coxiella endosymbiont of Amblyomma nuttalli]
MRLLNRYIRHAVVGATGLVMLILLGVEIFMEFIGQLSQIGLANFGFGKAFLYVLMQLLSDLYQLFPMAGFLGCLIGLGWLASSSQLIVMQAAGVSIAGVVWSTVKAALLMITVMTFVGELIAPLLEARGERIKSVALEKTVGYESFGPIWLRDAESFIFIGSINSNREIRDINRFVVKNNQLLSADYASEGEYMHGHWILRNITQSHFSANQIKKNHLTQLLLHVLFNPDLLHQGQKMVDQESMIRLYHTIRCRYAAGLQTGQYVFAFWQRSIQPLTTIVMICLGVPFIFGSLRQANMGIRILTGVIIGFAFYMLNQFVGPFAMVYQIPPVMAALMPTLLFITVCIILLHYARC